MILDSKFPPACLAGKSSAQATQAGGASGFTNIFWETSEPAFIAGAGIPV